MQKECIHCKAKFEAKKNTAKFCSDSCRVMYNRNSRENKEKRLSLSDRVDMIFWNFDTPITLLACVIWNISEYFKMPLGKFAPNIFSLAIGRKGKNN
ncbi:MAG: hypothetical protein RLY43_1242 [Bacteroidota bacterium]|jgi:predicted nucleic acid-binding Zn ribbon protein